MAQLFSDFGFINCYSLDGGYEAWKDRPQRAMPAPAPTTPLHPGNG